MIKALAIALFMLTPVAAFAAKSPTKPAARAPDLADQLAGTYTGSVISDARGSSRNNVGITITRAGRNMISISSDYARLPTVTVRLERAMDAILAASGPVVVLATPKTKPGRLDLTIDDASWSGLKQ
jgi:hypothetical protein